MRGNDVNGPAAAAGMNWRIGRERLPCRRVYANIAPVFRDLLSTALFSFVRGRNRNRLALYQSGN